VLTFVTAVLVDRHLLAPHNFWNNGMLEYWNNGKRIGKNQEKNKEIMRGLNSFGFTHYSIVPIFQHSMFFFITFF
jgi:hypothetical protein